MVDAYENLLHQPERGSIISFLVSWHRIVVSSYSLLVCFHNLKHCKIYKGYVNLLSSKNQWTLFIDHYLPQEMEHDEAPCGVQLDCVSVPTLIHKTTTVMSFVLITSFFFYCVCMYSHNMSISGNSVFIFAYCWMFYEIILHDLLLWLSVVFWNSATLMCENWDSFSLLCNIP